MGAGFTIMGGVVNWFPHLLHNQSKNTAIIKNKEYISMFLDQEYISTLLSMHNQPAVQNCAGYGYFYRLSQSLKQAPR
jgi:hypothetical protein